MEPERIAHFEILERLGAGAMGVVYRARDTLLGRDVALKLIRPDFAEDRHSRGRFLRECRAAASINHPGIATVYEAGESDGGQLYLASELIRGESLQARLARGRLPAVEVVDLGIQLGQALAAAHAQQVVHRDIKPANLMIQTDGRLKVLDFGLARLLGPEAGPDETATRTRVGMAVGTPAYMSPEQAAGAPVDARTDVFSAGSVLYAAASGKEPFLTQSLPETLRRILAEDPPPLESVDPGIPAGLSAVIRKALAKRPEERFASAAELSGALQAAKEELTPSWPGVPGLAPAARRRRIALPLGLGLAALAVVAAVVLVVVRPRELEFQSRDKLLIATVDNQTPEPAFDLALRTALEADLQQSRHASVFDAGQVLETLKLMRRDPGTPIDEALGRDMCRFAGVRALLLPRILAVGDAYELQAILVDPQTGRHVDRIRVAARGREEVLLHAIDDLARTVRRRLGESLESIERADQPVTHVTTSSWEALNYLALGNLKWQERKVEEAAKMFELALEKDPRFAAAKGTLGLLLLQFTNQHERGKQLLREALADSADLPERERLLSQAVNRQFVDLDLEGALRDYELISELYPDLMQPYNNRGRILMELRRFDEAAEMFEESARREPTNSVPLSNLWWVRQMLQRKPVAAEAAARRLVELGPAVADFHHMLSWSLICQLRYDEALPELRRVMDQDPAHAYGLPNIAHLLHGTGAPAEALPFYRRLLERIDRTNDEAARPETVRDMALALDEAGQRAEAETLVAAEVERIRGGGGPLGPRGLIYLAQLEAARGRDGEAQGYLARVVESELVRPEDWLALAMAQSLLGRDVAALASIERAIAAGFYDPYVLLMKPALSPLFDDPRFLALVGVGGRAT